MLFVDVETSGLYREGEPAPQLYCAVVTSVDGKRTVYRGDPVMTISDTDALAAQLCDAPAVCTFNGAAFDLRVIAEHASPPLRARVAELALSSRHLDVMLDFASRTGYYAGLSSFSHGHGTKKSMSGADAAAGWPDPARRAAIIEYCANDVDLLRAVVEHAHNYGRYERTSKSGRGMVIPIENFELRDPLVAHDCHKQLDLKWMREPPDLTAGWDWCLEFV